MASSKMLPDVVTIYNYIGEVDNVAKYSITILYKVFCNTSQGSRASMQGDAPSNSATLYVFDRNVSAVSTDGKQKQYLPYNEWLISEEKANYWTIGSEDNDFFANGVNDCDNPMDCNKYYKIHKVDRLMKGSARMWHWEMYGY